MHLTNKPNCEAFVVDTGGYKSPSYETECSLADYDLPFPALMEAREHSAVCRLSSCSIYDLLVTWTYLYTNMLHHLLVYTWSYHTTEL